jgi:hypothetical protein
MLWMNIVVQSVTALKSSDNVVDEYCGSECNGSEMLWMNIVVQSVTALKASDCNTLRQCSGAIVRLLQRLTVFWGNSVVVTTSDCKLGRSYVL